MFNTILLTLSSITPQLPGHPTAADSLTDQIIDPQLAYATVLGLSWHKKAETSEEESLSEALTSKVGAGLR